MASPQLSLNQHLLDLARTGRLRLPVSTPEQVRSMIERIYPLLAVFISLVIPIISAIPSGFLIILFAFISEIPLSVLAGLSDTVGSFSLALVLIIGFAPMILLTWIWTWLSEDRSLGSLGLEADRVVKKSGWGLLLGCLFIGICVGVGAIFGFYKPARIPGDDSILWGAISTTLLLAAWFVQGLAEEILFRGYLLPVVSIRYGVTVGILISSATFMILHIFNQNLVWIGLLNLLLYGIFAALYALVEGGIWGISGLHAAWNWMQGSLFGIPVSGTNLSSSSFLILKDNGPEWLTGGSFGPEGGLLVTLALVIAILYLFRTQVSRPHTNS